MEPATQRPTAHTQLQVNMRAPAVRFMGSSREIATGRQTPERQHPICPPELFILLLLGRPEPRGNPKPKPWEVVLRSFLMQDLLFHLLCRRLRLGNYFCTHASYVSSWQSPQVHVAGTLLTITPCVNRGAQILIVVSLITQYLVYSGFKEATDSPTV